MKLKLIALVILGLLFFSLPVVAYSPFYTHPDLTEEMAKLFNLKNSTANYNISASEIEWLRQGAIEEDDAPRWINHFYDPINKVGWSGKHFGTLTPDEGLKFGADFAPKLPMASVDWVVDQKSQALYGDQQGNQTWQKAVKSFIDGDRKSAFIALGHVLHLVEDATVPDHTRDDTHADLFGDAGSPYEKYSKEYTNSHQLNLAQDLKNTNFINFSNVQEAIRSLAVYSNNNFFSEDTINNNDFDKPVLNSLEKRILIINNKEKKALFNNKENVYLALENKTNQFTLEDKTFVLPSYRERLFPKAVLTGASVINLFFKDVEYYKQHPDRLEPIVPDTKEPLVVALKNSPKRIAVKISDTASQLSADVSKTILNTKIAINNALGFLGIQKIASNNIVNSQSSNDLITEQSTAQETTSAERVSSNQTATTVVSAQTTQPAIQPTGVPEAVRVAPDQTPAVLPVSTQADAEPSISSPVSVPSNVSPPKPSYILAPGYTPSPSQLALVPENQESVISVSTSVSDVVTSTDASTSTDVNSDTTTTTVTTSTVSVTTTITTSTIPVTTTVSTSTVSVTTTVSTSTVPVTTTTEVATTTTSSTPEVETGPSREVVINEVAWAGTASNLSNDEWFELYNNTDQDIDLTDWKIFVDDKQMKLTIKNKYITARGYYLLERKEDSVVRDISADAFFTGSLNNNGEEMKLLKPNGVKADEVDAEDGWFAGDNTKYRSMERLDPTKDGSDLTNWQSNKGYRLTGLNASQAHIYGSPRQPNLGYFVLGSTQEENVRTLDIENSPYVAEYYVVPVGKTLNVEPGVEILLPTYGSIEINGSLNAIGTQEKSINFSPYPSSTSWGHIVFNNSTSTLNFVNIKKGDRITRLSQNLDGMVLANNSNLTINNSVIWDSEANAVGGTDSVYNISNTSIGATVKNRNTNGINVRGGVLNLDNVTFSNLFLGVEVGGTPDRQPRLIKNNISDTNFINVDYLAEPLNWWNMTSST